MYSAQIVLILQTRHASLYALLIISTALAPSVSSLLLSDSLLIAPSYPISLSERNMAFSSS